MDKEETCIILDFLASGYSDRRHAEPTAQAIGTNSFSLLELVPREGIELKQGDEVYVGEGKRDKIRFIRGTLEYGRLTNVAKNELEITIEEVIRKKETRFVDFFNKSGMLTPRMHSIQLLPGVGKKHLVDLLDERKKKPFESFAEIIQRVKNFPDPFKIVVQRVITELESEEKYHLFTKPKPVRRERY